MTTENMFEIAARNKFRFDTKVGLLTVEDLWILPLSSNSKVSLDSIAIDLNRELKGTEESFVSTSSKSNKTLEQKFEIVKHVIKVRMEENAAVVETQKRKTQRERIASLIARKEEESLENLSIDELRELAKSI